MGLVLVGTVDSSYRVLETLIDMHAPIQMVLSLSPADAKGVSDYADLGPLATQHGVPHRYIRHINDSETLDLLTHLQPDVVMVIGWSQIVSGQVLSIPRFGCVGAHPALLPRNRGRAAIPWSILMNEKETGMTLFYLDEGIDSGDIIDQTVLPISEHDTARTIYDRAVAALCDMVRRHLNGILTNTAPRVPQNHTKATYCAKRTPEDGLIDWNCSTDHIWRLIRAVSHPYPGAFTYYRYKRLIIWEARPGDEEWVGVPGQVLRSDPSLGVLVKTGDGVIWLTDVELEGKRLPPANLIRRVGEKLGRVLDPLELLKRIAQLEAQLRS